MNPSDEANFLSKIIVGILCGASSSGVAMGALASIHANMLMNVQLTEGVTADEILDDHKQGTLQMYAEFQAQIPSDQLN